MYLKEEEWETPAAPRRTDRKKTDAEASTSTPQSREPEPVTRKGDEDELLGFTPRRKTVSDDKVIGVVRRDEPKKEEPRANWMNAMVRAQKVRALGLLVKLIVAVVGLFIVFDMVDLVQRTLTLPPPFRWVLVPLEVALFAAVLAVAVYVAWHVMRMPSFVQVRAQEIDKPSEVDRAAEIRLRLMPYVKSFKDPVRYAESLGLTDANEKDVLPRLRDNTLDSVSWQSAFDRFQSIQDRKANEIVGHYCKMIFVKTAICPWKTIDRISVFYNSTLMVSAIARVYNRKLSRGKAFRLVCSWVFNIYVAGELGAVVEQGAEAVSDNITESLAEDAPTMLTQALGAFSKLGGKAAEGGVNALLARRLGKRAIESFRARA